jgi:tyrosinase
MIHVHRILYSWMILALTPFWETQSTYWVSSQTTATGNLKYSYPEFNGLDMSNPNAVQAAIGNYINQQYGGGTFSLFRSGAPMSLFAQPAAGGAQAPAQGHSGSPITEAVSAVKSAASDVVHQFHSRGGNPHTAQKPVHGSEGQKVLNDWTVRIHFKKYELGGSFAVLIFLGQVPNDPSQWRTCPTFVGSHHAFVNSAASQCDNCRSQADIVVEGFVHLNSAIAERSGLSSYDPNVVAPYLKENLHWRVQAVREVLLSCR